jgi:hypothetical protein
MENILNRNANVKLKAGALMSARRNLEATPNGAHIFRMMWYKDLLAVIR